MWTDEQLREQGWTDEQIAIRKVEQAAEIATTQRNYQKLVPQSQLWRKKLRL